MEKKFRIVYYADPVTGRHPAYEWMASIQDVNTKARIKTRIFRAEHGNFGDVKSLGDGVFEFRIHTGPGYRLYFGKEGLEVVILLVGGDKSTQFQDIRRAKIYWENFKRNKKE